MHARPTRRGSNDLKDRPSYKSRSPKVSAFTGAPSVTREMLRLLALSPRFVSSLCLSLESNDERARTRRSTRVHLSMSALHHRQRRPPGSRLHADKVSGMFFSTRVETSFSGNCVEITNEHTNTLLPSDFRYIFMLWRPHPPPTYPHPPA